MRIYLPACLLVISACPVFAEPNHWQDLLSKLNGHLVSAREEERNIQDQIRILEEKSKVQEEHMNLLRERLAALNVGLGNPPSDALPADPGATLGKGLPDREHRENELISECADRIAILHSKDGGVGTAFLAPQEGKIRIFAPAPWIAEKGHFSLSDLNGNPILFGPELSCPVGFSLLGLHPENPELAGFELAANNELPAVGGRILVVVVDGKSKGLTGIGGSIRGIGPDTLEIDAEITQEMSGAPVLSLDTGKLIGIVAHQISGVADDWALGTRHQGSRNFAVRLDSIQEWEASDLNRFAKEAAYVERINRKTRIASVAHMLLETKVWQFKKPKPQVSPQQEVGETREQYYERMRNGLYGRRMEQRLQEWVDEERRMHALRIRAKEAAKEFPTDPHIVRVNAWTKEQYETGGLEPGSNLERNLATVYRYILSGLRKQEPDSSAHLSPYHKEQYRLAIESRKEGIRICEDRVTHVGR